MTDYKQGLVKSMNDLDFLKLSKPHIKDVAHVAKLVMVGFFVVYYLYTTYRYCQTGMSPLNTYPYVPFWEHGGF